MIELSLESSVYKLIYNSSHYLLDISYHYFKPMFLNIFIFSQAMLVLFLMSSWSFGYFDTVKSQILIPTVLCALHPEIEKKRFSIKVKESSNSYNNFHLDSLQSL